MKINLTIIFIVIGLIAALGIAGAVVLMAIGVDAAPFITFFSTTIATVVGFAAVIKAQSELKTDVTQVKRQTNGTLTRLLDAALAKEDLSHTEREEVIRVAANTGVTPTVTTSPIYDNMVKGEGDASPTA